MDIIDQIEIPSFERRNANFRRNFAIAAGCVGLFYALEQYNGSVSRTWKSVRRGVTAAIVAWLEDHGGFPFFPLEGEDQTSHYHSVLDLNGLCGHRLTHGDGDLAAAAYLTQSPNQDPDATQTGGSPSAEPNEESAGANAAPGSFQSSADTPNFFQSTKFFACLDVEEARELFRATKRVSLAPHEVLFRSGDPSDTGIYIVLHGTLGVFLEDPTHNTPPIHANTLRSGESVGDLDVVDGAVRTVSCMALESGCLLVNVPRELFMEFVHSHPRALMLYLQQGLARLWRVAHFVLADFLQLQLYRPRPPGSALQAETAAAATAGTPVPMPLRRTLSNVSGHERGTQTEFSAASSPPPSSIGTPPLPGSPPSSPPGRASALPLPYPGTSGAWLGVSDGVGSRGVGKSPSPSLNKGRCRGGGGHSSTEGGLQGAAKGNGTAGEGEGGDDQPVGVQALPSVSAPASASAGASTDAVQCSDGVADAGTARQVVVSEMGESAGGAAVAAAALAPAGVPALEPVLYGSPREGYTTAGSCPSPSAPSAPTFNELLASAAASARARGAGGPTHGPLRPEGPEVRPPSNMAAAAAAAALLANVPSPAPGTAGADALSTTTAADSAPAATAAGGTTAVPNGTSGGSGCNDAVVKGTRGADAVGGHSGECSSDASSHSTNTSSSTIASTAASYGASTVVQGAPPAGPAGYTSSSSGAPPPAGGSSAAAAAIPAAATTSPPWLYSGGTGARGAAGMLPPRGPPGSWGAVGFDETLKAQGPVCRLVPGRSQSLKRSFVLGERACLATGWDVIDVEELRWSDHIWAALSEPRSGVGTQLPLAAGGLLQDVDWASGCFYLLLDGHLLAERRAAPPGGGPEEAAAAGPGAGVPGPSGLPAGAAAVVQESGLIAPGSLISCAAFLSSTASRCKVVALEPSRLVAFSWQTLEALVVEAPELLIRLLVAASAALGPVIRRFISLGLNRVWLESGDVAYRQGDFAECLYVVISGRLRLLHETLHPVTHARQLHVEEEVGRGEAVGAVWAITGGHHDTTALCVRDSELVRMSRSAFRVISADSPLALSKLFSNIARRLVAAWDSRVRSDRGASSSNAAASGAAAAAAVAGGTAAPNLQQLPNPARLGLTPLKSAVQLAAGGGVVRGPRPSGRRGEIVTIAILPAGALPESAAAATMAAAMAGSPTDVAALAAALAAGEAASMGGGGGGGRSSGTGRAGSYSGVGAAGGVGSASWKWPPGLSKQAAALATLTAIKRLSGSLKDALSPFGPVLLLDATVLSLQFPTASERLDVLFYRSKVTSWMAAQEEEYRFILLEGDVASSPWSSVCVAQADCILLVAPEGSTCALSQPESLLVFNATSPAFIRPNPVRSGLTPAAAMTPAPSCGHLPTAAAAAAAGAGTAAAGGVGAGGRTATCVSGGNDTGAAPAAAGGGVAAVPGGVGGSHHPHHQKYGLAQQLYGASSAAMLRRVELVLLHRGDGSTPSGTADWLARRPNLSRHHHIRLGRPTDIQRLARWMAGKTVGIVLSGGGSRGLAHLGVLTALEDAGVPLDAVGGTSQGAFMAALYAQGLGRDALNHSVRHYAHQLSSVRHLLSDITLPVLSLFSGSAFDRAVKRVFERGAQRLEDLWLPFFCVTTNLTRGEASVHTEGLLWKLVRASMTIVGLLPPVWEDGCLLVDGGYMNNMPVDVMRSMMGVDSVVVVDVEGRDDMGWRSLTPYDGGLSGWRLLWDRLCPFPRWRSTAASAASWLPAGSSTSARGSPPRYAALINKLTAMTHAANLKRVAVEHRIDLYLRPPGTGGYRLMDFHLMDRIVKEAYRYATSAITQWKVSRRVGPFGIEEVPPAAQPAAPPPLVPLGGASGAVLPAVAAASSASGALGGSMAAVVLPSPAASPSQAGVSGAGGAAGASGGGAAGGSVVPLRPCMTQLQKKQQPAAAVLAAVTASVGGSVSPGGVPFSGPAPRAPPPSALRTSSTTTGAGGKAERRYVDFAADVIGGDGRPFKGRAASDTTAAGVPSALAVDAAASVAANGAVHQQWVIATSSGSSPRQSTSPERERDQHPRVGLAAGFGAEEGQAGEQQQVQVQATDGAEGPSAAASSASPAPGGLRPVMSRMTRSSTKHSLLDLH